MQNSDVLLQQGIEGQRTLNKILRIALSSDEPLADILSRSLKEIFSIPWAQFEQKGAIFLTEKDSDVLILTASHELSPQLHTLCARVPFGRCLCGKAALSKEIQFSSCLDHRHEIRFAGMSPHGHYNAPLLDEHQNVLGVLNLYLKHGHQKNTMEIEFLQSVCDVLVLVIKRKQIEVELSQAAETIRISQTELNAHLVALGDHTIAAITDTSGTITYANKKFSQISGYSNEELIGQNHRLLKSDHHPTSFFTEMYKTIANGETWHGELKNRAKDGSFYWVDTTISPLRNAKGKVSQYLAIRTDITARKKADDVLRRNVDILNTTFINFPGGISVFNQDLILQAANPAFYELRNLTAEEFPIGVTFEAIARHNAHRGEYGEGDIEALVSEKVERAKKFENHTFKRVTLQGKSLEIKGWPLPEGGFISTYMDITEAEEMLADLEQKSAEAIATAGNLRRTKEAQDQTYQHLVTSVNSMANGFVIWNRDDRLVLANEAYLDFHHPVRGMLVEGVNFGDMLRAGLENKIWNLDDQDEYEWLEQQLSRRNTAQSEREIELVDGREIIISDLVLDNGDVISTITDITAHYLREMELQDARDQLEKIAYFDTLTGLANRAHCQKDMAEKFAFVDSGKKFAVIQIDLDNFKRVNDTLGHAAGDHLLKVLAERMSLLASEFENFRSYRWGGDEFIALVERNDDTDLAAICGELTDIIAIPLHYEGATLRPTVSLGVARYPEDAQDIESLMIFSDLALYRTKELGRDGYQFFTSKMKDKIDTESLIEQELRIAIEADHLELYFQPQLDIEDETITGIEALIRWNHPEKGLIPPGEFLAISEAAGLAPAIGCKVFEYAMKAVRFWVDEGLEFGRLAVNLSPEHLKKSTFMDDFFNTMGKYDIEPHFLTVEFLESFILNDPNANTMDILKQFRARNIHVELDDFGTGYASLSHLSTMPITGLKIDKSSVDRMTNDKRQQGIVKALISISKQMKLRVVCEGIETLQQVDALLQIGKCSTQGYFIAKPMTFGNITDWIKNQHNIGALKTWSNVAGY